jgi:GTP-binding protein Era
VWVERDSQKAIIIGKGATRIKDVGSKSRAEIEKLLGQKVFLNIRVKVAPDWQRDPKQLGRLGF